MCVSLLPAPIADKELTAEWEFIPSALLGGDSFGYHWLDEEHFAIYLLDVCGHGVGAALLSISVTNLLRAQSLPNADFLQPHLVLKSLNETFQMEEHRNMFFTMWYGVYNKTSRKLTYASGGHPPAVLVSGSNPKNVETKLLKTPGLVVGGMAQSQFVSEEVTIGAYNKLFVFSDGVYELATKEGMSLQLDDLIKNIESESSSQSSDIERVLNFSRKVNQDKPFSDDFSIVKLVFNASKA